eukprot:365314-Chlamydomonas_euryale.AAC.2
MLCPPPQVLQHFSHKVAVDLRVLSEMPTSGSFRLVHARELMRSPVDACFRENARRRTGALAQGGIILWARARLSARASGAVCVDLSQTLKTSGVFRARTAAPAAMNKAHGRWQEGCAGLPATALWLMQCGCCGVAAVVWLLWCGTVVWYCSLVAVVWLLCCGCGKAAGFVGLSLSALFSVGVPRRPHPAARSASVRTVPLAAHCAHLLRTVYAMPRTAPTCRPLRAPCRPTCAPRRPLRPLAVRCFHLLPNGCTMPRRFPTQEFRSLVLNIMSRYGAAGNHAVSVHTYQ